MTTTTTAVREAVDRIVRQFDPIAVVLFGSHAGDTANRWSDIDLLVVMPDGRDRGTTAMAMLDTRDRSGPRLDVVVTTPAVIRQHGHVLGYIQREALQHGVVVYHSGDVAPGTPAAKVFIPEAGWEIRDMTDPSTEQAVRHWFELAEGDMAAARLLLTTEATARTACHHAQQAAEKAVKAVLVAAGISPERTHDLEELRARIPEGWAVRETRADLKRIVRMAIASRYPNVRFQEVIDCEYATGVAAAIVDAVRSDLTSRGLAL